MRRFILAAVIWLGVVVPAAANEYRAERFGSRIEILSGGSLRVTETIVFRFEKGTFKKVSRVIPTRRTDGVDFVGASMDGVEFPVGSGNGHVSVRRNNGLRVEWHFPPTSETTHTFVTSYVARGVATAEERADTAVMAASREARAVPPAGGPAAPDDASAKCWISENGFACEIGAS